MMHGVRDAGSAALVRDVFEACDKAGLHYLVWRLSPDFPHDIGSDVDLLVRREYLEEFVGILRSTAHRHGGDMVQCLQHECTSWYYVVTASNGRSLDLIAFDVGTDYTAGRRLFLTDAALDDRVREGRYWTAAPATRFAYYALKKVHKRGLDRAVAGELLATRAEDPPAADALLVGAVGSKCAQRVVASLVDPPGAAEAARLRAAVRRASALRHPAAWISRCLCDVARAVRRVARPTGLHVVVVGPDGVGKSSVLGELSVAVAPAFRRIERFHFMPRVVRLKAPDPALSVEPYGRPPYPAPLSFAKLLYLWFGYVLGHWFRIMPLKIRSGLALSDRHFHDVMADPARARIAASDRLLGWFGRTLPQPDIVLMLDAPSDVIAARKSELDSQAVERLRTRYRAARLRRPLVVVDASGDLEATVHACAEQVFKVLTEKRARG